MSDTSYRCLIISSLTGYGTSGEMKRVPTREYNHPLPRDRRAVFGNTDIILMKRRCVYPNAPLAHRTVIFTYKEIKDNVKCEM